jgi:flagella basal body P-ring formation protein FlgA
MKILLLTILFNTLLLSQISKDKIQEYLNAHFSEYDKVEYQSVSNINIDDIEIDYSRTLVQKSDFVFLPVMLKSNNRELNSIIRLKIKLFKNVFVAKKDIPFNSSINEDDFNYQLEEVNRLRGTLVNKELSFNNYKTKFGIKKGEVLVLENLFEIPAVKSGDKLQLEVRKGAVQISYEGIARQNGKIGEIIDVLAANKEILKAKVISSQKVLVE